MQLEIFQNPSGKHLKSTDIGVCGGGVAGGNTAGENIFKISRQNMQKGSPCTKNTRAIMSTVTIPGRLKTGN